MRSRTSVHKPLPLAPERITPAALDIHRETLPGAFALQNRPRRWRVIAVVLVLCVAAGAWLLRLQTVPTSESPAGVSEPRVEPAPRFEPGDAGNIHSADPAAGRALAPGPEPAALEEKPLPREDTAAAGGTASKKPDNTGQQSVSAEFFREDEADGAPGGPSTAAAPDESFATAMAQGLTALHREDYGAARAALTRAQAAQPGSTAVSDAFRQVDQAEMLARIQVLHRKARTAAQAEDWPRALEHFSAVLALDDTIQFAVEGRHRARRMAALQKQLDFFRADPDALLIDQQLQNAKAVLAAMRAESGLGARMSAQQDELEAMVSAAQTPVNVTITSDGRTEVVVYRVGRLGRFEKRMLDLRPGAYTIQGSRDGYQDVRKTLLIKPGQAGKHIFIACEKEI